MTVDFDTECFFIAPIGKDGSDIRKRSNAVRDWVVKPAAEAAGDFRTVRADSVGEPGQITAQAVQHCLKAKAAVADLTGGNPNVYYELSVRHGAQLPVVLIAENDTDLPFDISQSRVIFFDSRDLDSAGKAKELLQAQLEASLTGTPDNPISDGMRLAQLQAGNVEEQTLAVVLDRLQRLSHTTEQIERRLRVAEGGWVASPIRGTRGTIRPSGTQVFEGSNLEGYTVHNHPVEVEEVFGPEAFNVERAGGLSAEEKAEIENENRDRDDQGRPRPLSDEDPEAG